jgi:hypothetical protein
MTLYNYALIKDGIVENILVFEDPTVELLEHFKNNFGCDLIIDVTDTDGTDNAFASPGGLYSEESGFIPLKPYPSWIYNPEDKTYSPPTPNPATPEDVQNNKDYVWNEELISWTQVDLD